MAYKTIFESIKEKTGGKTQSREWYREQVLGKSPEDIITDERSDEIGDVGVYAAFFTFSAIIIHYLYHCFLE